MRNDVKSNYILAEAIPSASYNAGAVNSASADHSLGSSVSFLISVGSVGAAGTLAAKLQYSDDDTNWTDYPANDPMGNDDAIVTITAADTAELHAVNVRARYTRVVATVAVNAVVFGVFSVLGPKHHN